MTNLNANVRDAAVDSQNHKYPWKWYLSDLERVKKNGLRVFSCFSCGGGSSMGYKLAGFDVVGNCEIDPRMMKIYKENNHPKKSFLMDIRDFRDLLKKEIPDELKNLDILDGSPPCSVFSTAGNRESDWGKEKVFREGQKAQRLDDLFFIFIDVAALLRPKIVVAENVTGLIKGNAKGFCNEILKSFDCAGYSVQMFQLNASKMGVPQARERIFFIARRKDLNLRKINLSFNEKPILFRHIRSEKGDFDKLTKVQKELLAKATEKTKCLADIRGRACGFTDSIVPDNSVCPTITSGGKYFRLCDRSWLSDHDFVSVQTFPQDYNFLDQPVKYVCGMSVPPVMMAQISGQIYEQLLR